MGDLCKLIWYAFAGLFRSPASLEAEILVLRHQVNVLRRKSPGRLTFSSIDRMGFAGLYALSPNVLKALQIVKPDTVIGWHRAGFRAYWRWKSRPRGRRPKTPAEIRQIIREMSPSDRRVDRSAIHRGVRLARGTALCGAGSRRVYGSDFIRRIRAMGIRDRPISARSPWQNGYAEKLIGFIRRECRCLWRTASAQSATFLPALLQ